MMMTIRRFGGLVLILAGLLSAGCHDPRLKMLEQENTELRESMKEKQELLEQAQTTARKQSETITACHEKITSLETEIRDLELLKIQLRKELDFSQTKLARQTQQAVKFQSRLKEVDSQLREDRSLIETLKAQLVSLSKTPATTSAPAK
jgi:chromosome segregation ATPase